MLPAISFIDAEWLLIAIERQILWAGWPTKGRFAQWSIGLNVCFRRGRFNIGRYLSWVGCFVPKAARAIDRTQQGHQDRQTTRGLKTIGVSRQPAHCMKGNGSTGHSVVFMTK